MSANEIQPSMTISKMVIPDLAVARLVLGLGLGLDAGAGSGVVSVGAPVH
jgi:hypothetical protein